MISLAVAPPPPFAAAREQFEAILSFVETDDAFTMSHGDLEAALAAQGRELIRRLLQDHLDLRADREPRLEVVDAAGVEHASVETGHQRSLTTVFGEVNVTRRAYRKRGEANLHPADGSLNLPREEYSHGLRKQVAVEVARDSYEEVVAAIERATGVRIGKRQVEELAIRSAVDFDAYYGACSRAPCALEDVLVLSCDGKGIVMRPEALRDGTRKAAAKTRQKLATRLSRGEKGNRKRMAEVGCVYDLAPVPRTPEQILRRPDAQEVAPPGPKAKAKWVTASVVDDAATVVAQIFAEAERRDPDHQRTWIALVDGNNHQIELINREARKRQLTVHIVVDFIHVLEYLWKAAWCFHAEGDPAAEAWVRSQAMAVLKGKASQVAGAMRRSATRRGLASARREGVDTCATYLLNKRPYLGYPQALQEGWPIASGVIEGACRHLVKDRLDLTGARWGLAGAEAVLKLRALRTNGDFEEYWRFHLLREKRRVHQSRHLRNSIPGESDVP